MALEMLIIFGGREDGRGRESERERGTERERETQRLIRGISLSLNATWREHNFPFFSKSVHFEMITRK